MNKEYLAEVVNQAHMINNAIAAQKPLKKNCASDFKKR